MSYKIRVPTKTDVPDEAHLLDGMERFWFFVERHRSQVLGGIATVVALVAAVAGLVWYTFRQTEQAEQLTAQAVQAYLDRPSDKPTQADENLKKAVGLLREVVAQYPRSPSAALAQYHLGNAQVQANDLSGAIESYKQFINLYGANKPLVGLVYQRLGYAYLLNGDRDLAARAFSSVLDVPGALNKDQALFELGKLEEAQSRPEAALARYQELTTTYPKSPFASEASVRVKALEVKKSPDPSAPPAVSPAVPPSSK
jgi:outer membrane protein assembly factor BamD (BamD/ComL family)